MENTITRRTCMMLTGTIPFAVMASSGSAFNGTEGVTINHDPHHAWFDEWKRLRTEYLRDGITDGDENEHGVALLDRAEALADQIAKTQARTIDGVAAQLDWIDKDSDGLECLCPANVKALRNALATLRAKV